jgi:hypothetical protein
MLGRVGSYLAGRRLSGSGNVEDLIDCFNRSVHCRESFFGGGPSGNQCCISQALRGQFLLSGSGDSSASVVLPSVGEATGSVNSCFSTSVESQLVVVVILKRRRLGAGNYISSAEGEKSSCNAMGGRAHFMQRTFVAIWPPAVVERSARLSEKSVHRPTDLIHEGG